MYKQVGFYCENKANFTIKSSFCKKIDWSLDDERVGSKNGFKEKFLWNLKNIIINYFNSVLIKTLNYCNFFKIRVI